MAHEVKLHQALHGYSNGHQQLALSTVLKPRDQKSLLALSDISGTGSRLGQNGYITGYPLVESGYFALGRTWSAPEMPRPGCVWTHTLLIEFADLAVLDSLSGLLDIFRRPGSPNDFSSYRNPLQVLLSDNLELPEGTYSWTRQVVTALYEYPRASVVAPSIGSAVDPIVLAIWSQQWPKLRRHFKFCTFTASNRSVDGVGFDLQIISSDARNLQSHFPHAMNAANVEPNASEWLNDAMNDLMTPDYQGLRPFFRRLGSDVETGRAAFRALCRLYKSLKNPENIDINQAIQVTEDELGREGSKSAYVMVAESALKHARTLDESGLDFLLRNLNRLEPEALNDSAIALGQAVWRRDPKKFAPYKADGYSNFDLLVKRTIDALGSDEILDGLYEFPELLLMATERRPDLIQREKFWSIVASDSSWLEAVDKAQLVSVLPYMSRFISGEAAVATVKLLGSYSVLEAINTISESPGDEFHKWVPLVTDDIPSVGKFLSTQVNISPLLIYAIALDLHPDSMPSIGGFDPWVVGWHNCSSVQVGEEVTRYLGAYFLSRALGGQSVSPGELTQIGFEETYSYAAANKLPKSIWRMLEPRLPNSLFWLDWDKCYRLCEGVADLLIKKNIPPSLFVDLVDDDTLFFRLAEGVASRAEGKRYLKKVLREMKGEKADRFSLRIKFVKRL